MNTENLGKIPQFDGILNRTHVCNVGGLSNNTWFIVSSRSKMSFRFSFYLKENIFPAFPYIPYDP